MSKLTTDLRQALVDVLDKHNSLYHFDDDAHTICFMGKAQKPLFTHQEAELLNELASALKSDELFDMAIEKTNARHERESDPTYVPF